ncbi:hypothetical protein EIN_092170 [Entamoeba invadens IP1]|uniref:SH3 domain-containing protein n=1 Tax=Entamoeba invadens IP1 TaxID=370355 RepID=A0A0A1U1Z6_ENTIV|nr:hypothetical protein EIN_092170 [Entamoeba invadens IP1]ELP86652.1 hypothetical protein EIN_092170 [Entamoeba invadens IP1]|eukprot:XP_004185998.1 hypothetical protein EIN_092170 [Entamoeba invadens IP1]
MSQLVVKAKYSITSSSPIKLSYLEGESIKVIERTPCGVWKGEVNDQSGLFHISTVDIPIIEKVVMNYDFTSADSTCMKAKAGEVLTVIEKGVKIGWLYCLRGYDCGYVPQNFTTITSADYPTDFTLTKEVIKPQHIPCTVSIKYTYEPRSEKELSLVPGDKVEVLSFEGMWWYGRKENSFGYFPGEYCQVIGGIHKEVKSEGIVLFDYEAKNDFELSAHTGDVFYIERVVGSWAVVYVNEERYIFPSSYLSLLSESDKKIKQDTAITLNDFVGGASGLLSVKQSQFVVVLSNKTNGMSLCYKHEKTGLVPTSNLMTIRDGQDYLIVEKTFEARNQNEITVTQGQAWIVVKIIDENWVIGRRLGVEGFVPRGFVKIQKFTKPYRKEYTEGIAHINSTTKPRKKDVPVIVMPQGTVLERKEEKSPRKGFFTQRKRKEKSEVDHTKEAYEEKKQTIMKANTLKIDKQKEEPLNELKELNKGKKEPINVLKWCPIEQHQDTVSGMQTINETYEEDYIDEEKEKLREENELLKLELEKTKRERDFLQKTIDSQKSEVDEIRKQHEKDITLVASLQQTVQTQKTEIESFKKQKADKQKDAPPLLEEDEVISTLKNRVVELEKTLLEEKKERVEGDKLKAIQSGIGDGAVTQIEIDVSRKDVEKRVCGLQSRIKILTVENEKLRKDSSGKKLDLIKIEMEEKIKSVRDELVVMRRRLDLVVRGYQKS